MAGIPALAGAQASAPDTLFARSPWGAEAGIGGIPHASVLHVRPSGTALVFALSADNSWSKTTRPDPSLTSQSVQREGYGSVILEMGARHYAGHGVLLPYLEGGVSGVYDRSGSAHGWGGGVYGAIGASYFVLPRVTVGAAEELRVRYSLARSGLARSENWNLSLPYPTVRLAVFF